MRALLAIVLLSVCSHSFATDRLYGEIHVGVDIVEHTDLTFRSVQASVSFGGYFWRTIGIDVNLGGPLSDGNEDGFEVQLEDLRTLSLRFDSPPQKGFSVFLLFGVSQFTIEQRGVSSLGVTQTVREDFQGATVAIGGRQQIGSGLFSLVGTYRVHIVDEPIDVDSYSLGVRAAWK